MMETQVVSRTSADAITFARTLVLLVATTGFGGESPPEPNPSVPAPQARALLGASSAGTLQEGSSAERDAGRVYRINDQGVDWLPNAAGGTIGTLTPTLADATSGTDVGRSIELDRRSGGPEPDIAGRRLNELLAHFPPLEHGAWLVAVYSAVEQGRIEEALDRLAAGLLDPLQKSDFATVDATLDVIDVDRLDTHALVAVLSLTFEAKDELANRARLAAQVQDRLRKLAPDRVEKLISGLR